MPPPGTSNDRLLPTQQPGGLLPPQKQSTGQYHGFIAGVFSGITKLTVGHPFDTIKVRLQTSPPSQFRGPWDCLLQTVRKEGLNGLYKGASPPLVGWMMMDSLMLGSLTLYRRLILKHVVTNDRVRPHLPFFLQPVINRPTRPKSLIPEPSNDKHTTQISKTVALPLAGHAIAGSMAGWTVSFLAAPIEHVKARLQVQYAAAKQARLYSGPIDCVRKIFHTHGIQGLYHGLVATLIFRTFFCVWWGTYDLFTTQLTQHTTLSIPAINFWAGGLSAQCFWLAAYPADVLKQKIMTDPLGGAALGDGTPRFPNPRSWRKAARATWKAEGWYGYWRGFVPCALRAFPANACALVAFEGVMRALPN